MLRLCHVMKHVGMAQSDMPAVQNEATQRLTPPKVTTFAQLTIGTGIVTSSGHLRTVANGCRVADGCGGKRKVERTHLQQPNPHSETTLATHSGKTEPPTV